MLLEKVQLDVSKKISLQQMQLDGSKNILFAANAARRAAVTQNPRIHSATSRRTVLEIQLGLTDKQVQSCSLKPHCQLSASFHLSNSKCVELLATIRNVHVDVSTHVYHHNQEYLNVTPD